MAQAPFLDEGGGFVWNTPLADLSDPNIHQCFEPLVLDVYMGRWMVVVPHADNDTEKL